VKRENSLGALLKLPRDGFPVASPFRERWVEGSIAFFAGKTQGTQVFVYSAFADFASIFKQEMSFSVG